jgi:hypothetical protein
MAHVFWNQITIKMTTFICLANILFCVCIAAANDPQYSSTRRKQAVRQESREVKREEELVEEGAEGKDENEWNKEEEKGKHFNPDTPSLF